MEERKKFGPEGAKLVRKLVEARKALGFSLEELSARTRIRKKFLESIEADDLALLPSVYVHVFLKKYARVVGFKDWGLLESCRKEFGIPDPSALGENEGSAIRDEELAGVPEGEENFGAFVPGSVWEDPEPETGRPLWLDDLMRSKVIPVAAIVVGSIVIVFSLGALVRSISEPSPEAFSSTAGPGLSAAVDRQEAWPPEESLREASQAAGEGGVSLPAGQDAETPVAVNASTSSAQAVQEETPDRSAVPEVVQRPAAVPESPAAGEKASVPCPEWTGSEYVGRATFSTRVDRRRREPVDSVCRLSAGTREVFYFSEVLNQQGKRLYHVWEYGGGTVRKIPVGRAGGKSWRVWSRKSLGPGMTGTWTVKVVNGDGKVLHSERFEYADR